MKVTVVGSGHGGCAFAAVLAMKGHDVSILKLGHSIHTDNFNMLHERKRIKLVGIEGDGEFPLSNVTTDVQSALDGSDVIFVYYVTNYHPLVAEKISPFLYDKQIVILGPGYLGSLIFEKFLKELGKDRLPLFAELETLPFSSRIVKPGVVHISSRNVRHPFASYPASRSNEIVDRLKPLIGICFPRNHLIEVALHNPNLAIHTLGVLLNISRVENPNRDFAMYKDGFTPSMWNLVAKLDGEKMDVLEKLGLPRISYFDAFRFRTFDDTTIDALKGFRHYADEAPSGPFSINNRYITEDVPMGLGLLHSLGNLIDVNTPICDSLINIATALIPDRNFWSESRTIHSLWDGSLEDLIKKLTQ